MYAAFAMNFKEVYVGKSTRGASGDTHLRPRVVQLRHLGTNEINVLSGKVDPFPKLMNHQPYTLNSNANTLKS